MPQSLHTFNRRITSTLALIALLCVAVPAPAQPAGDIAFLGGPKPDELAVCVLHIGPDAIEIVGTGQRDGRPVWSPDGLRLAHAFDHRDGRRIRVVDADGSAAVLLPSPGVNARQPRWSPDGERIAFVAGPPTAERIYVSDLSARTTQLWGGERVPLMQPAWVSGDRLAAVGRIGRPGSQTTDLYWVTREGSNRIDEALPKYGKYLEWAPASPGIGDFLAFESDDGGDREIYVFAPQRGAIDVSNHRAADWNPRWSPDRRTIAFESFRDGRRGIYQVNALRVLVAAVSPIMDADAWDPDWSADGDWIVYVSNRAGDANLFASRAGGGETVQLTDAHGLQLAPAWRPSQ